jgi:hypothetical protein
VWVMSANIMFQVSPCVQTVHMQTRRMWRSPHTFHWKHSTENTLNFFALCVGAVLLYLTLLGHSHTTVHRNELHSSYYSSKVCFC